MADCPACTEAKAGPSFTFYAGREGCAARGLIRSPMGRQAFLASQKAGRQTAEYRALLARVGVTHEAVKEWEGEIA